MFVLCTYVYVCMCIYIYTHTYIYIDTTHWKKAEAGLAGPHRRDRAVPEHALDPLIKCVVDVG